MKCHWNIKCFVAVAMALTLTAEARVWLEVPAVGNCRGDTKLTCHFCDTPLTNWTWSRKLGDTWNTFMVNGTQTGPSGIRSSVREEMNGWFSLIIDGADSMAAGYYRCGIGKYQSDEALLRVECKPEHAEVRLLPNNHIEIQMNTVYPIPEIDFTLTDGSLKGTKVTFASRGCRGISWIQDCAWISTTALADGHLSYKLTATTVTETVFYGSIN